MRLPPGVDDYCRGCGFFFYTGMPETHLAGCPATRRSWKLDKNPDGSGLLRCNADAQRDLGLPGRCVCFDLGKARAEFGKALWALLAPLAGES